jgi:hypothetical protein
MGVGLLDLPQLCVSEIVRLLARALLSGHRVAVHVACREAHRVFAAPLSDAVDPGCVAELEVLRVVHRTGLESVRAVLLAGAAPDALSVGESSRLAELRAACVAAALPASGAKAVLLARLRAGAALRLERRVAELDAAREVLAHGPTVREPSALRCAVRARVRAAARACRGAEAITYAQAIAMGVDADVLEQLRHDPLNLQLQHQHRPHRVFRLSAVCDALLAIEGPGSLQQAAATAVPDPAAEHRAAAERRLGELRRARRLREADALVAAAGLTRAELGESRVDASAIARFAAGDVGAGAVRRMATAARAALGAQAARRAALERVLGGLGLGSADEARRAVLAERPEAAALIEAHVYGRGPPDPPPAFLAEAAARVGRRRALDAALAALGCGSGDGSGSGSSSSRGSRHCEAYVAHGRGDVAAVAAAVCEDAFYCNETIYLAELDHPDVSGALARRTALHGWVAGFSDVRAALAHPTLPATLRGRIRDDALRRALLAAAAAEAAAVGAELCPAERAAAVAELVAAAPAGCGVLDRADEFAARALPRLRAALAPGLRAAARRAFAAAAAAAGGGAQSRLPRELTHAFDAHMAAQGGWDGPRFADDADGGDGGVGGSWLAPFSTARAAALGRRAAEAVAAAAPLAQELGAPRSLWCAEVARAAMHPPDAPADAEQARRLMLAAVRARRAASAPAANPSALRVLPPTYYLHRAGPPASMDADAVDADHPELVRLALARGDAASPPAACDRAPPRLAWPAAPATEEQHACALERTLDLFRAEAGQGGGDDADLRCPLCPHSGRLRNLQDLHAHIRRAVHS